MKRILRTSFFVSGRRDIALLLVRAPLQNKVLHGSIILSKNSRLRRLTRDFFLLINSEGD
jgi:hypothetical protein